MKQVRQGQMVIRESVWYFVLFGILNTASQLAAYIVFSLTYVGYATAIFSLSSLLVVIFGAILFKEDRVGARLLGAAVMICGVALLAI
jgi:drug/metabolite transporter (DMT)-like permease